MKVLFVGPSPELITGQSVAFNHLNENQNIVVYNSGGITALDKVFCLIIYLFSLLYRVVTYRPDKIYVTISRTTVGFWRDFYLFLLARIFKIKVLVHLHGADFRTFISNESLVRPLIKWCYRNIAGAIVLSEGMEEQFYDFPDVKTFVVNNCFTPSEFVFSSNSLNHRFKVLYLSNLMKTKGVLELIGAVKEINNSGGNIHLRLAGRFLSDDELSGAELEDNVKNLLDENIEYVGVVKEEKKDSLINWCNCMALPSYYITEAQPITLMEAMAAGRYVLTSQAGYITEFVKHRKNGYILSEVSTENIIEALDYIVKNPREVINSSKYNAKEAGVLYTKERYVKQIFDILRSI